MNIQKTKSGIFKSWNNVYVFVIVCLVATIIFLYYLTNYFK